VIFLLDATLTQAGGRAAELFALLEPRLSEYSSMCSVGTEDAALEAEPGAADALVLANPPEGVEISEATLTLIEKAKTAGTVLLPVALDATRRRPPLPIEAAQSYDVTDRLRLRSLPDTALTVIAQELSWSILARAQPTLTKDRLRLFLCHRRADAEDLTRRLDETLSSRHEYVFRDLVNVQHGKVAQDVIEEALEKADILVFLDTPQAGESDWVARELALALGRQLPIVWARLKTGTAMQVPLPVPPAAAPHLEIDASDASTVDWNAVSDAILTQAFTLAREHVRTAQQTFARIRRHALSAGSSVETLDQRRYIYALVEKAPEPGGYPRRPRTDIIQVFGHRPSAEDQDRLRKWLEENDYGPHARTCRAFDAAVLLDPLPRELTVDPALPVVVDNGGAFLRRLTAPLTTEPTSPRRGLLLLGAFPEGVDSQEPVKQAVYAVATGWLSRGGHLVFGGHPTFTPLVTEAGQRLLGDLARERITIYQSKYWVTNEIAEALSTLAEVNLIAAGHDRDASLSEMRQRMVNDENVDIVVAVGGRTHEGGAHQPGIDEEIALAREAMRPVYLLGAPGGRAAELSTLAARSDWQNLGNLFQPQQNAWLQTTEDYDDVVELLWITG
jgi:SLOG cluster3 family/TIR domain